MRSACLEVSSLPRLVSSCFCIWAMRPRAFLTAAAMPLVRRCCSLPDSSTPCAFQILLKSMRLAATRLWQTSLPFTHKRQLNGCNITCL